MSPGCRTSLLYRVNARSAARRAGIRLLTLITHTRVAEDHARRNSLARSVCSYKLGWMEPPVFDQTIREYLQQTGMLSELSDQDAARLEATLAAVGGRHRVFPQPFLVRQQPLGV